MSFISLKLSSRQSPNSLHRNPNSDDLSELLNNNPSMEISSISLSPSSLAPLSSSRSRFFAGVGFGAARDTRAKSGAMVSVRGKKIGFGGERERKGMSCNALFGLGVPELVVIAGVAALVFGPKKLPEVGRSIGRTVKSFQQAAKEFETELKAPEAPPEAAADEPKPVIEEEKQDEKVQSSKESV